VILPKPAYARMSLALCCLVVWALMPWRADARLTPEQLQKLPPPATTKIDFARDIKPLFEASCIKCHGRGKEKGGFKLDTRETFLKGGDSGPVAVSGQSASSYLIELVSGLDPDNVMPMKGSKLTPAQVGLLRAWIEQGMPWNAEVTFAKPAPLNLLPRQPELPPEERRAPRHPIDRILAPYFAQHGMKPPSPVDDRTYARRVYLDVIGLLPTPAELEAFTKERHSDKRERLVTRLLADHRRYAAHWLTFWNDLLRNDYRGTGYIDGGREQISSWLYAALATNMPYNQFVAELIHPPPNAAGFTKGIVWRGTVNASQIPPMQAAQNISQVFMGVNLKCASCHDSFINDWALTDAYALANIYADEPLEIFQCDKPTGKKAGVGFIYPELGQIPADAPKAERTKRLAEILTQKKNGRLSRTIVNRLWAKFLGRGLIEPTDDMEQRAWSPDLLDWLAEDLVARGYNLQHTMRTILTSQAYQLPAVSQDEKKDAGSALSLPNGFVFAGPSVRRLSSEQFRDALGQVTGVWFKEPARGVDLAVPGADGAELPLPASARWIWSQADAATKTLPQTVYLHKTIVLPGKPTTAWTVMTCDNSYTLYVNGAKVASGQDVNTPNLVDLRSQLKAGTNLIAVAAVNHTRDNKPPKADQPSAETESNPAGFLFFARIQLEHGQTELASDKSWTVSEKAPKGWEAPGATLPEARMASELGGAGMAPWNAGSRLAATLAMSRAHESVRSSLVAADPLMLALGRPTREQVISTRASAATTLQALELTNGDTLSQLLSKGAANLLKASPDSNQQLVTRLYQSALGRKPNGSELRLAEELVGRPAQKDQVEDLLWVVAMLPEFQLIY
jgi:mono/diheme cytochrome c family protein